MADLELDTEVMVKVTPIEHYGDVWGVRIEALSLEHDISKVVLWKGGGRSVRKVATWEKSNGTLKNESKSDVPSPKSANTSKKPDQDDGWQKKDTDHSIEVTVDESDKDKAGFMQKADFPVLVDIYEEGDKKEKPDGHRHGWFDETGKLKESKNHKREKQWQTDPVGADRIHWYGRWHEGKSGKDLPEPPTYKQDDK